MSTYCIPPYARWNGRAFASLTARGGGLPIGVTNCLLTGGDTRDKMPLTSTSCVRPQPMPESGHVCWRASVVSSCGACGADTCTTSPIVRRARLYRAGPRMLCAWCPTDSTQSNTPPPGTITRSCQDVAGGGRGLVLPVGVLPRRRQIRVVRPSERLERVSMMQQQGGHT